VSNLHNSRKGLKRPPVTMGALFTRILSLPSALVLGGKLSPLRVEILAVDISK
jgi:hypothetical protein